MGDQQECGDFKRGACFRATCKFLHGGKPASEVAGSGIPGSVNGGTAGLPTPKPASQFIAPPDMDYNMYDPNTGFGLFGTSAFGTRHGQMTPLAKIDNVRPLCMDFYKNGFCNRRGPHNQGCLFRHDEIEGQPGKIESVEKKVGKEVEIFKAESNGWNSQYAYSRAAYSDVAKAAREWSKKKEAEAAAQATAAASAAAAAAAVASSAAAAVLPAGWKEAKAPDGRTYYFHSETKAVQWTKPAAPSAVVEPPLPAGWKEAKAPDGRTYYYRPGSQGTQWTRPTEPADAPAAAPASAAPASADAAAPAASAPAAAADASAPSGDADADAGADANGDAAADESGEPPAKRTRPDEPEE